MIKLLHLTLNLIMFVHFTTHLNTSIRTKFLLSQQWNIVRYTEMSLQIKQKTFIFQHKSCVYLELLFKVQQTLDYPQTKLAVSGAICRLFFLLFSDDVLFKHACWEKIITENFTAIPINIHEINIVGVLAKQSALLKSF